MSDSRWVVYCLAVWAAFDAACVAVVVAGAVIGRWLWRR